MSGHKREIVIISQEEYRRMYEAERAALYSTYTSPQEDQQSRLHDEALKIASIFEQQTAREDAYAAVVNDLTSQLKQVESHSQRLVEQERARIHQEIQAVKRHSEETSLAMLQQQSRQMEHDIEQQLQTIEFNAQITARDREEKIHTHFERRLSETQLDSERYQTRVDSRLNLIENQVHEITQRNYRLHDLAKTWMDDIWKLFTYVEQQYDERFQDQEEIFQISTLINQSVMNYENGIYEACIANCQMVAHKISTLRVRLENLVMEYTLLSSNLDDQVSAFYRQVLNSRTIPAINLNNQIEPTNLQLDVWAKDGYADVIKCLENMLDELNAETQHLTFDDLQHIQEQELPGLRNQFYEMIDTVQVRSLNSQVRFNIAQLVVTALVSQGHKLDSCGFDGDNYLEPYQVKASSIDGSQVLIRIDPIAGELLSSHLHIIADDPVERSHTELIQRAKELNRSLRQMGLQIQNQRELTTPKRTLAKKSSLRHRNVITVE